MAVTQQARKVNCDNCNKECEIASNLPLGWFTLDVTEYNLGRRENRLHKDLCSKKCLIKTMQKTPKLKPRNPIRI